MQLFLETMAVNADGSIPLLFYHHNRYRKSCSFQAPSCLEPEELEAVVHTQIKNAGAEKTRLTCRFLYSRDGSPQEVQIFPRMDRNISRAAVIECSDLSYPLKSADRSMFEELHRRYPGFDEIVITRNGKLGDGTFTNLYVRDPQGGGPLFTPSAPLLQGCMRAMLLERRNLEEAPLELSSLPGNWLIGFINALNPPGKLGELPLEELRRLE